MSDTPLLEAPDASPWTVFFSYSRSDQKRALPIIRALESAGYKVWWDGLLEPGSVYLNATEHALENAKAVVVLWSETSTKSHWVLDEAMSGRSNQCMVPLSIQSVQAPLGFRQFQTIDFEKWRGDAAAPEARELLAAVAALHGREAPEPRPAPIAGWDVLSRRRLLVGGASVTVAGLTSAAIWNGLRASGRLAQNGIVVLPFANLSPDPAFSYVSSGLASEIRASLAGNPALRVVGETSSEALASQALDASAIARKLGVSWLLEGVLRVENAAAALQVSLSDGDSGFQVWTETFANSIENLLALKDDVAARIVSKLTAEMTNEPTRSAPVSTDNAAAFNEYLKGVELYRLSRDNETDLAALAHFEVAISLDPRFAAAHAARAKSLTVLGNGSAKISAAAEYYDQAASAAAEAVRLGPDLADTHSTLGFVLFQAQLKVREARAPYERSRELGGGDASVLARYAGYSAATGRYDDALAEVVRAIGLDPLNPTLHRALGFVQYSAGDYEKSIESVEQALQLNPELGDAYARIGAALIYLDRPEEGLAACEKERNALVKYPCQAIGFARINNQPAADEAMKHLVSEYGDSGLYQQAQVLAQWRDADGAMARLQDAKRAGDSGLTYLGIDPALDPLRSRPDFAQLREVLGFDRVP